MKALQCWKPLANVGSLLLMLPVSHQIAKIMRFIPLAMHFVERLMIVFCIMVEVVGQNSLTLGLYELHGIREASSL